MTVSQLIAHLEKLPGDAVIGVVFQMHSELVVLDEADLILFDKTYYDRHPREPRFVLRNGQIMRFDEETWDDKEEPRFVSVLSFPGN